MPLGSGLVLGILSLVCYLQARLGESEEPEESLYPRERGKNLILALVALFAYVVFLEVLGFLLSSFLLLLFLFRGIEPQRWTVSIGGSALASFLCYVVFQLWLKTQLPRGILGF